MKTKQVLVIMKVISWIIFIGLCIKAGAMMVSFFVSLFVNNEATYNLYSNLDLSSLYKQNQRYFIVAMFLLILLLALKVFIFYLVIKIFSKFNLNNPFSLKVTNLVSKIGYVSLGTGVIAVIANSYRVWLINKGFLFPFGFGGSEFLFMAGILLIVVFLFKRGVELQNENDLTI